MSDTYTLYGRKCPFCETELEEVLYHDDFNNVSKCSKCGGTFEVKMRFELRKVKK